MSEPRPEYVIPETCCPICEGRGPNIEPVVCYDCRRDMKEDR